MTLFATVVFEVAVFLIVIAAVQLAMLAFRNPYRSAFLSKEIVQTVAATVLVTSVAFAIAMLMSGLVNAGLGVFAAIGFTAALGIGTGFGMWRLFGVGERLRRADAGQSPFYAFERKGGDTGKRATS